MSAEDPSPTVTEVWVYAGRSFAKGKIYHLWVTPDGGTVRFASLPGRAIGSSYRVCAGRDEEDGKLVVTGDAEYLPGEEVDERQAQWQARDTVAAVAAAAARAERRAARVDALEQALEPLMAIAVTLRTAPERDAFVAHVIRRLSRAWA